MNDNPFVIKNIVSNFEKDYWVSKVSLKTQKFRPKTRNVQNSARKMISYFNYCQLEKTAFSVYVSPKLMFNIFHDDII